jgi:parvulin-like peptidyl-prolyl isomerase
MWPGQLSQVLSSEYGFVILKVHERETARNRDTTSVERKRVEEALLYKRKRMLLNEELERLREIYPVERRMTQDSSSL